MPAEVEGVKGELSSKVDVENERGDRQDIVGLSANQELTNGIGDGDDNAKEETDGSYALASKNNAIVDDPVESDPYYCKIDCNVEKDGKEVEKEGEIGNSWEQKMEDRKIDGFPAGCDKESQTMAESEAERANDVEKEGPLPVAGNSQDGEAQRLESTEKVVESEDSEVGSVDFPDTEGQIKSGRDIDVERVQGEKTEGQETSELAIDAGHKSEILASKDVHHSEDEIKHSIDSDGRGESERISSEIPPDCPEDEGMSLGQPVQTISGPTVNFPESDENDGIRSESVAVMEAVSVEESEVVESQRVNVSASDKNNDVQFDSEVESVHASDDKVAIGSESGALKASDIDENGSALSESGDYEVASLNPDGDINANSRTVSYPSFSEGANTQLDSHALEVPNSEETVQVNVETRALDVSVLNGNENAHLESKHISEPASDQDRQLQVVSDANDLPTCRQDIGSQLESKAVDAPLDERRGVTGPTEVNAPRTAIVDALPFSNQQDPEQNGNSELEVCLSPPAPCEAGPTENDTKLDLSSDISARSSSEDLGPDMNQKIKSDTQSEQEFATVKEKCAPTGQNQENSIEASSGGGADVCQNMDDDPKSSYSGDLSEKESDEKTETLHVNLNGSQSGSDPKTIASELIENSSDNAAGENSLVGSESEAVHSGKMCSEPPVYSPTTDSWKTETETGKSSVVDVTAKDACKDVPAEEAHETAVSLTTESSVIYAAEEVESGTKSFQITNPAVNNDTVGTVVENDPEQNENESSCTTTCRASETMTFDRDLKTEVPISTDTPPTETEDVVSETITRSACSQNAEGNAGTNVIGNESMMCTYAAVDEKAMVEAQSVLRSTAETADATDAPVASTCDGGHETLIKFGIDIEIQKDQTSTSSREGSAIDSSEGHTEAAEIGKKPFYFLPRIPRYDDEKLSEEIKHAELEVDQKTRSRDATRAEIQKTKATSKEYDNFRAAIAEDKSAREALHSKRKEIESLQSVINRAKNAMSVDDIDTRVHRMEHMIQHETLPLKEEKQFIREIKQLKQLREQISSNMGTQDEVQRALEEKEKTEERLKVLRKELDMLRNNLSKAEPATKAAWERYDNESDKQKKLLDQFKAADIVRQEAYAHLQSLRKQLREKNKHFFKCRDDSKTAIEMALRKERGPLQNFCLDRVEAFMNLWNKDGEFRKNYIRCNTRSTLRRFGTLDGRSLGPDEEPIQITRPRSQRADKLRTSNDEPEKHEMVPPASAQQVEVMHSEDAKVEDDKPVATTAARKNQNKKSKKPIKSTPPPSSLAAILLDEAAVTEEEQPKLTKEEEELIREAEEKRKQEEAAKLREQHRLEEITKAKEAMERKKKKEEKAKARAAVRAQKEAEEKEKEREKKLRKKERRKATASEEKPVATSETQPPSSEAQTETPRETEQSEKQTEMQSQPKKPNKKSQLHKQNKSKSIPPPLKTRNSKRRLQLWMWVAAIALLIFALFILGNTGLSS